MHSLRVVISMLAVAKLGSTLPAPQWSGWDPCDPNQSSVEATYTVDGQNPVPGTTIQLGQTCTNCPITYSEGYTVGWSVTVGVDLGIDLTDVISAGVSYSVTSSTSWTNTEGVSKTCTGPWTCAGVITPWMIQVSGSQTQTPTCGDPSTAPYTLLAPELDDTGVSKNYYDICSCPNYEHWADPGAPPVCPQDCT